MEQLTKFLIWVIFIISGNDFYICIFILISLSIFPHLLVEGYPCPTNNEVQSQGNYNMMNSPPMRPYYYQSPQYYYPMPWYPQRGPQVPPQPMPQQWFNPNPWYTNSYPTADQNETSTTDQSEMVR